MIYSWPILNQVKTVRSARRNAVIDTLTPGVSTDYTLGAVTVDAYSNLENMNLGVGQSVWTSYLDEEYLLDSCRIIGMGIEVYDVTSELYKQGTCTVFQVPQSTSEPSTYLYRGGQPFAFREKKAMVLNTEPDFAKYQEMLMKQQTVKLTVEPAPLAPTVTPTPFQGFPLKKYPSKMSVIMTLEGTRQWEAKDGAYTVIPFHGRDNFAGQPTYEVPLVYVDTLDAGEKVGLLNTTPFNVGYWAEPLQDQEPLIFLANKYAPMDSKGILLSGVNAQSVFTINVVYYLESFPGPDDPGLISLARPSCQMDDLALELISVATQELPIAVPVNMNGLGDWFADVVSEVAPWIATLGTAAGMPYLGVAAGAAKAAADTYIASRSKSKQPSPPSPAAGKPKTTKHANIPPPPGSKQSARQKRRAKQKQKAKAKAEAGKS